MPPRLYEGSARSRRPASARSRFPRNLSSRHLPALSPLNTRKGDYLWRLERPQPGQEAGIDDVGIGVLFGLYEWRFEVLGLVAHALYLQQRYGVGPHTSVFRGCGGRRGRHASGQLPGHDTISKRLIAILRLAVPTPG